MKKFVSLLMALLFVMGICVSAVAEDLPRFSGLVTDSAEGSITVVSANGNSLTFQVEDPEIVIPGIGSLVDIEYSGDLAATASVISLNVAQAAIIKTVTGTVTAVEVGRITVKPAKGNSVTVNLIGNITVSGKADTYKEGDTVTVTYAECTQFMSTMNLATDIEVTAVKQEKKDADNTNKKMTGVVTSWLGDKITVRTSKGKKYTFKVNTRTKYPSKKSVEEGCTVSITYDGNASAHPYAKKINVTKTKSETDHKTHKKSGTVDFFGGMVIGLTNGFTADVAYARHSGKGAREPGRKVTVYYYTEGGENYATKIKWK